MTIADILGMPTVRNGRPEVISGQSRLDTVVRWVHVSEVRRLSTLLQGGELILSTGLSITGGAKEDRAYVRELARARAAGLVIELGPTTAMPSGSAVDLARELGFPIVVLHREVPFVSITEQVHRSIVSEQMAELEFAQRVHESFTELSVTRASSARIVETLGRFCRTEVVLEDLARHVVAFHAGESAASSLLADWEARSRLAPIRDSSGPTGPEGWLTCPVGPRSAPWGRLVLPLGAESGQEARLLLALERAASALEIARLSEHEQTGLLVQAQGGLIQDLEAGAVDDPEAMARAAALGLRRANAYLPLVVRWRRPGTATEPLAAQRRASRLLEMVTRALERSRASALLGVVGSSDVGAVLALGADRHGRPVSESTLLTRLEGLLSAREVVVGVGVSSHRLTDAGRALAATRHVAQVATSLARRPGSERLFYRNADVRLAGLVALLADEPRVQAFVEAELGPLLQHEAVHKEGLVALLRRYLELGGNKSRLAADISRSRSSLYERLARIETILRLDISDASSRLSLGFAFLAYDQSRRRSIGPDLTP